MIIIYNFETTSKRTEESYCSLLSTTVITISGNRGNSNSFSFLPTRLPASSTLYNILFKSESLKFNIIIKLFKEVTILK